MSTATIDVAKRVVDREIKKSNAAAARRAYVEDLKACAEESQALMADKRYPRHQKWLTELRAGYSRALEATDPKLTTEIAKIQGKIANIDTLMNHAAAAVKEYEALRKSEEGK
jgi:hypothetical protein